MRKLFCALSLLMPVFDDRPLLTDLGNLPSETAAMAAVEEADRYLLHLQARGATLLHSQDAEWCREAWRMLREVRGCVRMPLVDSWAETHGRSILAQLREHLGPDNYYAGNMPPPVPLWRFELLR